MKIWLDTCDCDVIADAAKLAFSLASQPDPTILSQTKNVRDTLSRILDLQPGPVAAQVTGQTPEEIIEEARAIYSFSKRMVVKIPVNRNGLIAMQQLQKDKIPLLGTGILFSSQAFLAGHHKTAYISPYFSHIANAQEMLGTVVQMFHASKTPTQILVASLREVDHIIFCATLGVYGVTIKPDLYHKLIAEQPVVEGFSKKFLTDWMQTHGPISIEQALRK